MKENYLDLDVYIHFKSKNCQDVSQENGFPLYLLSIFREAFDPQVHRHNSAWDLCEGIWEQNGDFWAPSHKELSTLSEQASALKSTGIK